MTEDPNVEAPVDLKEWLVQRQEIVTERWFMEVLPLEADRESPKHALLLYIVQTITLLLSHALVNGRGSEAGLWEQACDLYGALALQRSLASGEVVEEIQRLRSVVLRLLLESPPACGLSRTLQKDVLALNRLLDVAVVRATVAYTDDLFFAHLQGSGVPEGMTQDVEDEMRGRLDSLRRRMDWS